MAKPITLKHKVEYFALRVAMLIVRVVPRSWAVAGGRSLGAFAAAVLRIRRNVTDENLRVAFGDAKSQKERDRIAVASYCHFGGVAADALRLMSQPTEAVMDIMEPAERPELFDDPMRSERGACVMASGHYGFWDVAQYQTLRGHKVAPIFKPMHNPLVDKLLTQYRTHDNLQPVSTLESMRPLIRLSRKGYALAIIADQDARKNGVFIDFFGKPASTHTGSAFFALKLGVPLLPFVVSRQPNGKYRFVFDDHILPPEGVSEEEAVEAMTREFVAFLERQIRQDPGQYWWFHRRWKTQPKQPKDKPAESDAQ